MIPFDMTGNNNDTGVTIDEKSHQWFGATLASSGEDGVVVVSYQEKEEGQEEEEKEEEEEEEEEDGQKWEQEQRQEQRSARSASVDPTARSPAVTGS